MANKNYSEFPAGTPDPAKIFLQADPVTGELEKIFIQSAAGNVDELQIKSATGFTTSALLKFLIASGLLQVGSIAPTSCHIISQPAQTGTTVPILRLIHPDLGNNSAASLSIGVDDSDSYLQIIGKKLVSGKEFNILLGGASYITGRDNAFIIGYGASNPVLQMVKTGVTGTLITHASSTPSARVLKVQASPSQTANIFEVTDSSGGVQLAVKPSGVQLPSRSTTQINSITGMVPGQTVFDNTIAKLKFWNGSAWETVTSSL